MQLLNHDGWWNWLRKKARASNPPAQGAVSAVSAHPASQDDHRNVSRQLSPEFSHRIPIRRPLDVEQSNGDVRLPSERNCVLKTIDA